MSLRYFGFWPGQVASGASIDEQGDTVNVTKTVSTEYNQNSGEWGDVSQLFARAAAHGQQVIVNLCEGDDRDHRFGEWAAQIRPYIDQVYGFFLRDEPDCVAGGNPALLQHLLAEVGGHAQHVRQEFPGARTMFTIGCFHPWIGGFSIPEGVTDIGLEAYHGEGQWREWLDRLGPYLRPDHRIWLMPFCYNVPGYYLATDADIIHEAQVIYDYAKTDPRIWGLLPFAWYDGVRERPAVRAYFAQIGREIVRGCVPPPADHTLRLDLITPHDACAGRPFTLAFLGHGFAPGAVVQYAPSSRGPWATYPAQRRDAGALVVPGIVVGPGLYWVRVQNPAGTWGRPATTVAHALQIFAAS